MTAERIIHYFADGEKLLRFDSEAATLIASTERRPAVFSNDNLDKRFVGGPTGAGPAIPSRWTDMLFRTQNERYIHLRRDDCEELPLMAYLVSPDIALNLYERCEALSGRCIMAPFEGPVEKASSTAAEERKEVTPC